MNIDYRHWTLSDIESILDDCKQNIKCNIIRTVLKPDEELPWNDYYEMVFSHGMKLLAVQARESGNIEQYAGCFFDYLQVCNEPFNVGPSSWTLTPEEVNEHLLRARELFRDAVIIAPGLADGDETKLDLLDLSLVDYVACHPGIETVESIDGYLDRYSRHSSGKKIIVSEYYDPLLTRKLRAHPNVYSYMFFCYDDVMVEGHGLYDHGVKKPAYHLMLLEVNQVDLNVGSGIINAMTERGDIPIRDSEFVTNINGTVYERGYGEQGTYEASNASGDWRVYFRPFL